MKESSDNLLNISKANLDKNILYSPTDRLLKCLQMSGNDREQIIDELLVIPYENILEVTDSPQNDLVLYDTNKISQSNLNDIYTDFNIYNKMKQSLIEKCYNDRKERFLQMNYERARYENDILMENLSKTKQRLIDLENIVSYMPEYNYSKETIGEIYASFYKKFRYCRDESKKALGMHREIDNIRASMVTHGLKERLQYTTEKLQAKNNDINDCNHQISNLKSQIKNMSETINEQAIRISSLEIKIEGKEKYILELVGNLSASKITNNHLESEVKNLKSQKDVTDIELHEKNSELVGLKDVIALLHNEIKVFNEKDQEYCKKIVALKKEIVDKENQCNMFLNKNTFLENRISVLNEEYTFSVNQLNNEEIKINKNYIRLEGENTELKIKNNILSSKINELTEFTEYQNQIHKKALTHYENDEKKLTSELESTYQQISNLKKSIENLKFINHNNERELELCKRISLTSRELVTARVTSISYYSRLIHLGPSVITVSIHLKGISRDMRTKKNPHIYYPSFTYRIPLHQVSEETVFIPCGIHPPFKRENTKETIHFLKSENSIESVHIRKIEDAKESIHFPKRENSNKFINL